MYIKNEIMYSQCQDALPDTKTHEQIAILKRKKYREALSILDIKLIDAKKKTDLIRHDIKQVVLRRARVCVCVCAYKF